MFKVGDRIRRISGEFNGVKKGDIVTVHALTFDKQWVYLVGHECRFDISLFELVEAAPKAHKHAALIKAWADNPELELQFRGGGLQSSCWYPLSRTQPDWSASEIRIKPEPKPDYMANGHVVLYTDQMQKNPGVSCAPNGHLADVRCTFDGETGKLKSVELVK